MTCWHGPGVIENCFTTHSEGQKIHALSVCPWVDGKLVRFLLTRLERHLILICCLLRSNWNKRCVVALKSVSDIHSLVLGGLAFNDTRAVVFKCSHWLTLFCRSFKTHI